MDLLDLPLDLLNHIMGLMNVRCLLCAASTCRTLRALAAELPLHPVMTSQTRMTDWLVQSNVAPRVVSLTARCSMWGRCSFLGALTALRALTVSFGHVRSSMMRFLPVTLEHLDVHRLGASSEGDVFLTKCLRRFTRLHTLKLTFKPSWDIVVLDGLEELPLRHLEIRLAPSLVLRSPLRIKKVHLHAVNAFINPFEICSEDLSIECVDGVVPLDLMVTPESCRNLRRLSLCSPHRVTVPSLQHMHKLEHLHVRYDSALMPLVHMTGLANLASLHLETRYGVAVAGRHAKLSRAVEVKVVVGGVPLLSEAVASMFYHDCAQNPPPRPRAAHPAAASAAPRGVVAHP